VENIKFLDFVNNLRDHPMFRKPNGGQWRSDGINKTNIPESRVNKTAIVPPFKSVHKITRDD